MSVYSSIPQQNIQEQTQNYGNQQAQDGSHIHSTFHITEQQNVHQFHQQQSDSQVPQQGHDGHLQINIQFNRPSQEQQLNTQQTYFAQTTQQNQEMQPNVLKPVSPQNQVQQVFATSSNSPLPQFPEQSQGSDSTMISHPSGTNIQTLQPQSHIQTQYSSIHQSQHLNTPQEKPLYDQYQADIIHKQETGSSSNTAFSQHEQISQSYGTRPVTNIQPQNNQQYEQTVSDSYKNQIYIQQQYASPVDKHSLSQDQFSSVNIPQEQQINVPSAQQQHTYQQSQSPTINEPQRPYMHQQSHPVPGDQFQQQTEQRITTQNRPIISDDRKPVKPSQVYISQQNKPVIEQNYMVHQDKPSQHHTSTSIKSPISTQAGHHFASSSQQSTQILHQSQQTQHKISAQEQQHFIYADPKPEVVKEEFSKKRPSLTLSVQQQHVHHAATIPEKHAEFSNQAVNHAHSEQKQEYADHFEQQHHEPVLAQEFQPEYQNENPDEDQQQYQDGSSYLHQFDQHFTDEEDDLHHLHKTHQQSSEDKYSALKPIAQITNADSQSHVHHDILEEEEDTEAQRHEDEKVKDEQYSNESQLFENDSQDDDDKVFQHSVQPFEPETPKPLRVKTRPGVTAHPHFHPVGHMSSPEPEESHDLFPAPSRPLKRKPTVPEQDFIDQEFVEEDIPQEFGEFDDEEYEFYETTPTPTTTTTTKKPTNAPKRKPVRRPPNRFSQSTQSTTTTTTTTSKPYQQEFVESFDNHQPDSHKPLDHQEFFDDYDTTTPKKYAFVRSTTTRRPSTKSPIQFASFPTVSPTAEAYGVKQHHSTKAPINPFESYHCPTPHCNGYNCSLIRGPDGCQKCVCDSPCAPCPQHCVKTKTLSEGRCPICDCTVAPTVLSDSSRQCPIIEECGGDNCRKVKDTNGCYTCLCEPKCAEPKCDPGCEVLRNVPPGQCPGCVCRVTVVQAVVNRPKNCPAVQCTGPLCRTTRGPNGCLQCICDKCPSPKCDPGCELKTDVAQGQCPTCVCPTFNNDDQQEEDTNYCPNLFCSDYGCREIAGPAGCPICMCDPECEAPKCDPGCQVVTNKHMGRCPVCICSSPSVHSDNSSPNASMQSMQSSDGIKTQQVPHVQQQEQTAITFSGLIEPVVAENESASTIHTTVTVDLETTTEPVTTEEPTTTTTELTSTTEEATCPPPVCSGLRCSYETGEDGCEVCKCRYKCPKPKCQGSCYAETNAPPHRCPGCVCPSRRKPNALLF